MDNFQEYMINSSSFTMRDDGTSVQLFNSWAMKNFLTESLFASDYYSEFFSNFEVKLNNKSAGEIFNLYEELILDSKWDVRENGDYQTFLLGRDYMFYTINDEAIGNVYNYYDNNENTFVEKEKFKVIEFMDIVNYKLVLDNDYSVFDTGSMIYYKNKLNEDNLLPNDVEEPEKNLQSMLFRNNCRKFSENWFAISGFNLITHSINVNHETFNTMSEIIDEDGEKRSVSILGEVADEFIIEKTVQAPIEAVSGVEDNNRHRSDEFLANKLLEELGYIYQGSIIIKYNPKIEIGDTITLLDNVNSIFGVFEIDSFEHSLDNSGLITSLIIKTSISPRDPFLDYYSQNIGYKLINQIKSNMNINEYSYDSNSQFLKIMSLYLKQLVQQPKYFVFYTKKQKGFFNKHTVIFNNVFSPSAVPLRFFPMFKKGKMQVPKSVEYAFLSGASKNNIKGIIDNIQIKAIDSFNNVLKSFTSGTIKLITFLSDMFISTLTFNMSELIKPFFGMTYAKADKAAYDEIDKISEDEALSILNYNPYGDKYKLIYNNFDLKIGFFNVRCQSVTDLFAGNKMLPKTGENASNLLNRKINVVKKMMTDVFDCMYMVEIYNGFNTNEQEIENGIIKRVSDNQPYTYEDFVKDCEPNDYTSFELIQIAENTLKNGVSKEYGAILFKNGFPIDGFKKVKLYEDNRYAIETHLDVTRLFLGTITRVKIVFFHNLYGQNKLDKGINTLETRKKNVDKLIREYIPQIKDDTGIIIVADFNLTIHNKQDLPFKGSASETNATYSLPGFIEDANGKERGFIAQIKDTATTLNKHGYLSGNLYDNVLISNNLKNLVKAQVFEYPEKDKLTISDHIPLVIGLKKLKVEL